MLHTQYMLRISTVSRSEKINYIISGLFKGIQSVMYFTQNIKRFINPSNYSLEHPNWELHTTAIFFVSVMLQSHTALLHIDCAYAEKTHNTFFKCYEKSPQMVESMLITIAKPYIFRCALCKAIRGTPCQNPKCRGKGEPLRKEFCYFHICVPIHVHISHDTNEILLSMFL